MKTFEEYNFKIRHNQLNRQNDKYTLSLNDFISNFTPSDNKRGVIICYNDKYYYTICDFEEGIIGPIMSSQFDITQTHASIWRVEEIIKHANMCSVDEIKFFTFENEQFIDELKFINMIRTSGFVIITLEN